MISLEVNEVDEKNREATHEHGSKCIDFVLGTERVMNILYGIELIECNKIVDSDHRGYLFDFNLEEYFDEKITKKSEMEIRTLNPNKRNHRKLFVEKCEESLDAAPIEAELDEIEINVDINKIEQTDRDMAYMLCKARSNAEGERKGIRECKEKMIIRSSKKYWTLMVKKMPAN